MLAVSLGSLSLVHGRYNAAPLQPCRPLSPNVAQLRLVLAAFSEAPLNLLSSRNVSPRLPKTAAQTAVSDIGTTMRIFCRTSNHATL
jgi:hypothetical protein